MNQFNAAGDLTHLLTLEGLPKEQIVYILDTAKQFVSITDPSREVKKVRGLAGGAAGGDGACGPACSAARTWLSVHLVARLASLRS